jgi:hypothetical protein
MAVDLRRVSVPVKITDVSTAETIIVPVTPHTEGQLVRATHCLGAAISAGDTKIIISKNGAALGTITVANTSSAAGDIDFLDFGNVFVKSGDFITIAGDGGSTDTAVGVLVLDIAK